MIRRLGPGAGRRVDRRRVLAGVAATIIPLPTVSLPTVSLPTVALAADGPLTRTLEARPGTLSLVPTGATAVWSYDGHVPGPLLRVRLGAELGVRLVNKLDQPTSLTWHGVRVVNAMDGVAGLTQPPVPPGGTFDYRFTPPDAGLYWYHPHVRPSVAEQVGRGLYGVLIVDEAEPPPVDLDLLVMLDDWSLDAHGQVRGDFLDRSDAAAAGRLGPLVTFEAEPALAGGTVRPGARVRLRLLNACGARIAVLAITGAPPTVIAVDGQPSEPFRPARDSLPIGPGARFEVMLDMPGDVGREVRLSLEGEEGPDQPVVVMRTAGAPYPARPNVIKLPDNPLLPTRIALEKSARHEIIIAGGRDDAASRATVVAPGTGTTGLHGQAPNQPRAFWTINGVASDGSGPRPLFTVKRGTPVTLTFNNKTMFAQQIHVHGHVWRLLHDLDDGWDPYWRDSVLLAPGRTKHVAFIADNPGKWALESAIRDHGDTGLASWFQVT